MADQRNHGPTIDGYPIGNHLVGPSPVRLRLERASVGRIGVKGKITVDGQGPRLYVCLSTGGDHGTRAGASAKRDGTSYDSAST